MNKNQKFDIAAYLPAVGRERVLKTLELLPENKVDDLLKYLGGLPKDWCRFIDNIEYKDGKPLEVRISHVHTSF